MYCQEKDKLIEVSPGEFERWCYGCNDWHPVYNLVFRKNVKDPTGYHHLCAFWDWAIKTINNAFNRTQKRNIERKKYGKKPLEFNIDEDWLYKQYWIIQKGQCFWTGNYFDTPWMPLSTNKSKYAPTLDRKIMISVILSIIL
ncbi:hypothetical protein CV093_05960 [Oceanobacillus sp. 143]|nr:hypothetical protein CV093_05960 [Oceanobacillus sp. 143]